jgi:hypothetical protein
VVRAHDPLVGEAHRGLGLGQETPERRLVAHKARDQLFDGHRPAKQGVLGLIDMPMAAPPDGAHDAEAAVVKGCSGFKGHVFAPQPVLH